jgi:hypothetical protein
VSVWKTEESSLVVGQLRGVVCEAPKDSLLPTTRTLTSTNLWDDGPTAKAHRS